MPMLAAPHDPLERKLRASSVRD